MSSLNLLGENLRMKKHVELFVRTVIARGYVRVKGQFTRDVNWLIASVVGGFLTMATYVYLYRSIQAPEEFSAMVLIGGFMTPYWLNVLWSVAVQLYWEKEMGNLQIIILSPAPLSAFLLGLTIGGMFQSTIRAVIILLIGIFVFKVSLVIYNIWVVVVVFLISLCALYGVGMMFSSLFLFYGREMWRVASIAQEPVSIASGIYFPIKLFGRVAASVVSLIPLSLGLDALRQLLLKDYELYFLNWKVEVLILVVMWVVFTFIAIRLLNYVEQIAKREARLTLRWQ